MTKDFKFYLYYVEKYSTPEDPFFSLCDSAGMGDHGYMLVREETFTVDVPDVKELMPQRLATLEREKQTVRAAYLARVREIETQMSKLQALENHMEA